MSLPLQTGQLTMDKGSGKDFYNKDPGWHFKVSFNLLSFRLVFAGKKKNWGGWKKMIVLAKCFWDHPLGTFLFQFKISILQPLNVEITICRNVREIDIKLVMNSTALLFFNKYRTNFDNILFGSIVARWPLLVSWAYRWCNCGIQIRYTDTLRLGFYGLKNRALGPAIVGSHGFKPLNRLPVVNHPNQGSKLGRTAYD